jgi:hypothetical protein
MVSSGIEHFLPDDVWNTYPGILGSVGRSVLEVDLKCRNFTSLALRPDLVQVMPCKRELLAIGELVLDSQNSS